MSTNINFNKKLGISGGTNIILPSVSPVPSFADTKSFQFDGITDSLTYGTTSLGITNSISVSAWVKIPTTNTGGGGTNIQVIIAEDPTSSGQRNWNLFWRGGVNSFYFVVHNTNLSSAAAQSVGVTPNSGQWIHILATYDGTANTNGIKLYIDGVLNAQGTASSTGINSFTSSEPNIGRLTGQNQWNFEGNIDEVAVWNSQLSQSEVLSIFNGGVPDSLTAFNPLLWLRMGEESTWDGSKFVLDNQGSLGGTATSQGILPSDPNPTTDVPLFDNKSFTYDGVADYVDCGDNNNLSFGDGSTDSPFSISSWWYMTDASNFRGFQKFDALLNCEYRLNGTANSLRFAICDANFYNRKEIVFANLSTYENQWINVVATYNANGLNSGMKLYINGTQVSTTTNNDGTYVAMENTSSVLTISKLLTNYSNGKVNDTSLFNSELTQANVSTIFNGGLPNDISALSPLGYWRAEQVTFDGTDWTLIDQGSGGNNGTSSSMPLTARTSDVPLFDNKSFAYDGIADYVNLGDNNNLSFGDGSTDSPFSISAWIKIGQTSAQGIVTKYGSTTATREYLFYTTGGKIRLLFIDANNGANNFATGTTSLSINTWYHVCATYDGSGGSTAYNGMTLYINGISESVATSGGSYTAMSNTSQSVEIGKYSTNELLGNINDTSIFNTELTQANVTEIYNGGISNDISNLNPLGYWRSEFSNWDGSSWTMIDQGSGANNGTSVSMPLTSRTSDVPT